jgi:hypothetical protein
VWRSYRGKSPATRIALALIISFLLLSFVGLTSVFAVIDHNNALIAATPSTPTPTVVPQTTATPTQAVAFIEPTTTPTVQHQATAIPTPTPTLKPTPIPTHAIVPTQPPVHPTPTKPACQAVNNNPWCYNFVPGNYIYIPPSGFCGYFNCILSFIEPDDPGDGYIVECNDGMYSQSGGERGACSYHHGVIRPLYSH